MLAHPTDGLDDIDYGVHLRWAFNAKLGFPPQGFQLYRRLSDPEQKVCIDFGRLRTDILKLPYTLRLPTGSDGLTGNLVLASLSKAVQLKVGTLKERATSTAGPRSRKPAAVTKTLKVSSDLVFRLSEKADSIELEVSAASGQSCELLAYSENRVIYQETVTFSSDGTQTLGIQAFAADSIAVRSRNIQVVKICYWRCGVKGRNPWEGPINGDCGFGLPGRIVTGKDVVNTIDGGHVSLEDNGSLQKLYDLYCDKVRATTLCRLKDRCRFSEKQLAQLSGVLDDMEGDGSTIPVGWGLITQSDETPVCTADDVPAASIDMSAYVTLQLNRYDVDFATLLGLYFTDSSVDASQYYDYMVVANWPQRRLWRLSEQVTFDDEATGRHYSFTFQVAGVLFDAPYAELIAHRSGFARTGKALVFRNIGSAFRDESEIYIQVAAGCREVQLFIEQDGASATLEALSSKSAPAEDSAVLTARQGVLAVHAPDLRLLRLRGSGIRILRIHYDEEYLPYGPQRSILCGLKIRTRKKLDPPDPVSAKPLSGSLVRENEDCSTETFRFRAGLKWALAGDPEDGILANGPICYHIQRRSPRNDIALITAQAPVFVSPEDDQYRKLTAADGDYPPGSVSEEYSSRLYYHDAVAEQGRYGYRVAAQDLFGRLSNFSAEATVTLTPPTPPPPDQVRAKYLDYSSYDAASDSFSDPMLMADEKYWLRANGVSGLVVRWQWSEKLKAQAPEVDGFRIYLQPDWLNLLRGTLSAISSTGTQTRLTVALGQAVALNALKDEKITCDGITYSILGNTASATPVISVSRLSDPPSAGLKVTIALKLPASAGGAAIDYTDKDNWQTALAEESIISAAAEAYEVYIAEPPFPDPAFIAAGSGSETEKTRYAQIGVTSRTPDQESAVSSPVSVMAIYRTPPEAQAFEDSEGLMASKADWFGKSTFHLRWDKAADSAVKYDVYRGMDRTLFIVDAKNRTAGIRDETFYDDYLTSFQTETGLALSPEQIEAFKDVSPDYDAFNNNQLKALANLPDNLSAFSKLNDAPISQDDAVYQNRITDIPEPGAASAAADSSKLLYSDDSLDGLGSNRYFYRLRAIDDIGNLSDFGMATFPVSTPQAYVPAAPSITSVSAADGTVTVCWQRNVNADVLGYNLYCTDVAAKAGDIRRMTLLRDEAADYSFSGDDGDDPRYTDSDILPATEYFYRVVAVIAGADGDLLSPPSRAVSISVPDLAIPAAPIWEQAQWVLINDADGGETAWPEDGIVEPGFTPGINLAWSTESLACSFIVQRQLLDEQVWSMVASAGSYSDDGEGQYSCHDAGLNPGIVYRYRIRVLSSGGIKSTDVRVIQVSTPLLSEEA
jgi:hypothetical protein